MSALAAFLPLEALDPHVIAGASQSDTASGRSMRFAGVGGKAIGLWVTPQTLPS